MIILFLILTVVVEFILLITVFLINQVLRVHNEIMREYNEVLGGHLAMLKKHGEYINVLLAVVSQEKLKKYERK